MNLDWRRLKAVVLESDDWGLCAWSPDEQARRVLADTPAFRSPAGQRYGGSTLESAADIKALAATLSEFKGGDGFPPVWQANMIVAAPDYSRMRPPRFEGEPAPLVDYPAVPSRWARPGAWEEAGRAQEQGLWWPELHGLHHLPETAWLTALRRGADDARRAWEQQSAVCVAVESSGEYAAEEPAHDRTRRLEGAVARFTTLVGRAPRSFCPPDYRWDALAEQDASRLGIPVLQGRGEQHGARFPKVRRFVLQRTWPAGRQAHFDMPPRIAFEPSAGAAVGARRVDADAAHAGARAAWNRGQPAVVSTHRVNYAHLDPRASAAGRGALRDLLQRLALDGAVFLTDDEVRQLVERQWSVREIGRRGALVRYYGVPRDPVRFAAPAGARAAAIREGRGAGESTVTLAGGEVTASLMVGEYLVEWS